MLRILRDLEKGKTQNNLWQQGAVSEIPTVHPLYAVGSRL